MQASIMELLRTLLFNPTSDLEFGISALLGVVAFVAVLNKIGTALDLTLAQTGRSIVMLIVGIGLNALLLGLLDSRFDLLPWMQLALAGVVLLVAVVPLGCFIQKGGYLSVLFALLIGTAAAIVAILFVHAGFMAVSGGGKHVERGLLHNREAESMLGP